jgi:hypothetical protein
MGFRIGGTYCLLKTDQDSTVTECACSACVGIGAKAAERTLGRLIFETPTGCLAHTFDQLVAIACYAVWVAKETVDGCGGPTQLVTFHEDHGGGALSAPSDLVFLERAFEEVELRSGDLMARLLDVTVDVSQPLADFDRVVRGGLALKGWRALALEMVERLSKNNFIGPKKPSSS